ncbi:hypothetical protein INT45_001151 [Circinella minor]|uniref:Uncharacterized protein n=1 Tax=Circinella minor TaxID=1195481 RepID=A0A8H7S4Z0_9FUNG|nr:hypothetical protein INT45_001151 [Circinella minor]
MATNNPYKKPDNEKKGGLTPVIPGLQPQYDQPLRRPSSSSVSSASHKEDSATTTTTTKPTVSETEQPQPMPFNTQTSPTNSYTPSQQQPQPMPLNKQPFPSDQYTPPAPQQLPVQTNTQQQTNIPPPPSQSASTQASSSQPNILLTQQHTPSEQEQQPPSYASSQQQQQNQPPIITAMHEKDISASPELSSAAQKMKEKLHDRYRLNEEPPTQTFSPRQEHAQQYQDVSAEHLVENPVGDPTLDKLKSGFWKGAGKVQATLGDLSGLEKWQDQGRTNEAWADTAYREAESRHRLGEASWLNGEYNVIMGKLTDALGYVAGDPEMQAKARLRAHEGQQEIERLKR